MTTSDLVSEFQVQIFRTCGMDFFALRQLMLLFESMKKALAAQLSRDKKLESAVRTCRT
jgi:hypothetical protein